MTTTADASLGELADLAVALGLAAPDGSFNSDWLTRPGDFLGSILANDDQRRALLDFVAHILDSGPLATDALGRTFAPVATAGGGTTPSVRIGVVLDDRADDHIGIGLGVHVEVPDPHLVLDASVPLFRSARGSAPVEDNIFLGQPGADITVAAQLQLAGGPPSPGEAHLGGVSAEVRIPTDGSDPQLTISLQGLQLPGGSTPRDVSIDPSQPAALAAALRDLVFGLAQSGADALTGPAGAVVGLLGLRSDDALPALPLDRLVTEGPSALAAWLDGVLADAGNAGVWLGQLATAIGGTRSGDTVIVTVDPRLDVSIQVRRETSPTGLGRITVALGATLKAGPDLEPDAVVFTASADLCTIDVAGPSITLLPLASVFARVGPPKAPDALINAVGNPAITVGCLRAGLAIGSDHQPVMVLAADRVRIGTDEYASVDLTDPGAIAQIAANAGAQLLDDLLAQLGTLGDVLRDLLGVGAAVAPLDVVAFVTDPLGALRTRWKTLLDDGTAVIAVLTILRDLLADAGVAGIAVSGDGSPPDTGAGPWTVSLVGSTDLLVWRPDADRLVVALASRQRMDTLGQRCTVVKTTFLAELVELDLTHGSATFVAGIDASLTLSARGADEAVVPLGPITIMSKPIGLDLSWRPAHGLRASLDLREVLLAWDGIGVFEVPIPTIADDGTVTVPGDGWTALQPIIGLLAGLSPDPWLSRAVRLFGWDPSVSAPSAVLDLAELVADPLPAIEAWLARLVLDDLELLQTGFDVLARLFTGIHGLAGGLLSGRGVGADPLLVPFGHHPRAPALSVFVDAESAATAAVAVGSEVQIWRPGAAGLEPGALADAIAAEAAVDPTVADLLRGRPDVAGGLAALVDRWTGTDGIVVAPTTDPPNETLHLLDDVGHRELGDAALSILNDLTGLDAAPAVLVCVANGAPTDSPFAAATGDVVVDLSTPNLAPEAFTLPIAAAGRYVVALGTRVGARVPGDPPSADPAARQADRLGRLLDALLALGQPTAVVAHGGAGQPARLASASRPAIGWLVLAGTPTEDVALQALDTQPAADALRLLAALTAPVAAADRDDDPAGYLGQALTKQFMALVRLDDPAGDLGPPLTPVGPITAEVHRVLGALSTEHVSAGITAVVVTGLAARARARAEPVDADAGARPPAAAWLGVRLPLPDLSGAGDSADLSGWAEVLLVRAGRTTDGAEIAKRPHLRLHLEIGGASGSWLAGGPDPSRGTAPRPDVELRRLHADLWVPLPGAGDEPVVRAELVLHEATVFGVTRERWVVRPLDATAGATPVLPEVRSLLSAAAGRWRNASDPATVQLRAFLAALGVLHDDGSVADAVEHLLTDPDAFVSGAASPSTGTVVAGALAALLGGGATANGAVVHWDAGTSSITADLGVGTLDITTTVAAGGDPAPAVEWHGTFHYGPTAQVDLSMGFGASSGAAPIAVLTGPFRIVVDAPGVGIDNFVFWPIGGPDWATHLAQVLARWLPAELARLGLDRLRSLDVDAQPVIDALLDALGLLEAPAANGTRTLRSVLPLFVDPGRFFTDLLRGAAHVDVGKLSGLLDALAPILGVTGGPGHWDLAAGVSLRAITDGSGRAALAVGLDTRGLSAPQGAPARLWAAADLAVAFAESGVAADLGLEVGADPSGSVRVDIAPGVTLELRPSGSAPIRLYPDPAGLGQLASAALAAAAPSALATVLDAIAARSGQAGIEGDAGELVADLGDALDLRTTAKFDPDKLHALAADPPAYLAARAAAVVAALANRLAPMLSIPASRLAIAAPGGVLTVTAGPLTCRVEPAPIAVSIAVHVTGVPGVGVIEVGVGAGSAGLDLFAIQVGPAPLPVGGASLLPYARFVPEAGTPPTEPRRVELGLGLTDDGTRRLGFQWLLDAGTAQLVRVEAGIPSTNPVDVATAVVEVLTDVAAAIVLAVDEIKDALDHRHVGTKTIREILEGVLLTDDGTAVAVGLADPDRLLGRVGRLAKNLAGAVPPTKVGGVMTLAPAVSGDRIGVTVGLDDGSRLDLVTDPITVSLETDASWISRNGGGALPAGIEVFVADVTDQGDVTFQPGVSVNGLGLRFGRSGEPLLDLGLRIDTVAFHVYCEIDEMSRAGGGQVELAGLAVSLGGATGGDNSVASGIMADAKGGASSPPPKFSPALSVQKHGAEAMKVGLRAGPGDGPWWIAIQRALGPVYLEQVGFGVTLDHDDLESLSLLVDGRVTLFGLTAAVDDLRITYFVLPNASLFDGNSWAVDLAGLAISGDLSGLTISGGLLKLGAGDNLQYLGSLAVKFGPYGLSVFGGYSNTQNVVSFFAFGALNAPIGGPPAFFVTGIGGGIGINRSIVFPTELTHFNEFPFIRALDPASAPPADPMAALAQLADIFPIHPGNFWFAAGLSFTSFALIDGVVVISVQIGDGFELALLGLGRVALPRPQFALVSIELGLLARFSTSEGCFIIQAALTDNSWVLVKQLRLTGGFAFATWWKGPNRGHAVMSIGGYHPNFHRDGYPVVPRIGVQVDLGIASLKAGFYFALTSEAIMAGGRYEVAVDLGFAGASLEFEANGIIFFDPFQYDVDAHARVSAWADFGLFSVHVSLGASLHIMGPSFHGEAELDLGPGSITVEFGDSSPPVRVPIPWEAFVAKYLEEASPGVPRALSAVTGAGTLPAEAGEGADRRTPDGVTIPFRVYAEFEALLTTSMPAQRVEGAGAQDGAITRSPEGAALGIAPHGKASIDSTVKLRLVDQFGTDHLGSLVWDVTFGGGYPVAVWGPPQDIDHPQVPAGKVIDAITGVALAAIADIPVGTNPIPYHQVEALPRKPNPLASEARARNAFLATAHTIADLVADQSQPFATARAWLAAGGASRTEQLTLAGARAAPPLLGTLADGLTADAAAVVPSVVDPTPATPFDRSVHAPRLRAVLTPAVHAAEHARLRTTVADPGGAVEVVPRRLAEVADAVGPQVAARLAVVAGRGASDGTTVMAAGAVPVSRSWRMGTAAVAGSGEGADGRARLRAIEDGLTTDVPDADLAAGEIAVFALPNAAADTESEPRPTLSVEGAARVVMIDAAGGVVLDESTTDRAEHLVPVGCASIAVVAGPAIESGRALRGWHTGLAVAYAGRATAVLPGGIVRFEGARVARGRERFAAGWVLAAELARDAGLVVTHFAERAATVAVLVEGANVDPASIGIGLTDARIGDAAEVVPAPVAVVAGLRTALLYDVSTDGPFTVTVRAPADGRLAAVLASAADVTAVAADVGAIGVESLVPAVAVPGPERVRVTWHPAPTEGPA